MLERQTPARPPQPGEGKRGEKGRIGYLLRQAAASHRQRVERAIADLKVTLPQFLVLTMLEAYPGASNAELARVALLTPQTVSVIVANLLRSGSLIRRPHLVHGRIQQLDLSEDGRALLLRCRARVHRVERDLLRGLPRSHEQVVRSWLVRIAARST